MNKYKNLAFKTIVFAIGSFGSKNSCDVPYKALYDLYAVRYARYEGTY